MITTNDQLNPKLWTANGQLKPGLAPALINIAKDFKKFVGIEFAAVDLVITGSQAGYNWGPQSDLDLHLIVDYGSIDCDRELAELFDTKRHIYNRRYDIRVYGIPVELYVEDLKEPAEGPAWSIPQARWLKQPKITDLQRQPSSGEIAAAVKMWSKIIDAAIASKRPKILKKTQELLRKYRQTGLKNAGEFSVANLAYKTLRNQEMLAKLAQATDAAHSRSFSVAH